MNKRAKQLGIPYDRGGCLAVQQGLVQDGHMCPAWKPGKGCLINQVEVLVSNSRTRELLHWERGRGADDWRRTR